MLYIIVCEKPLHEERNKGDYFDCHFIFAKLSIDNIQIIYRTNFRVYHNIICIVMTSLIN